MTPDLQSHQLGGWWNCPGTGDQEVGQVCEGKMRNSAEGLVKLAGLGTRPARLGRDWGCR